MRIGYFILGLTLAAMARAQYLGVEDINALPSAPADVRYAYGKARQQFGELRLPKAPGRHAVAVILHGGCWVERYADIRNTAALADALRGEGIATWNVEYRREDEAGGGWPGTLLDAAQAIDALRELAKRYPLDLSRVVAIGHSAGAQLALWAAGRHRLPRSSVLYAADPLPIKGVLALGAIADLARFNEQEVDVCGEPVVTRLMGGSPKSVPERYAQGSPRQLLPLGVRQILVTAVHDFVESPAEGSLYVEAARAGGDKAEQRVVRNASHFEYLSPESVAWPMVRGAVFDLIK